MMIHCILECWVKTSCLSFKGVGNATACVMKEKIYVTGGHYGYRGNCTYETVQVYRPDINEWSIITTTPHPGEGGGWGGVITTKIISGLI